MRRIPAWRLGLLAGPAIPLAALSSPLFIFLPPFYAGEMGLGLAATGLLFLIARIWDVVIDPIVGIANDRTQTRWGRRRPALVLSIPILCISIWALFMPGAETSFAMALAWLLFLYLGYTLAMIGLFAWAAELSDDYLERSRIMGFVQAAISLGTLLVMLALAWQQASGADARGQIEALGWLLIVAFPVLIAGAVAFAPEPPSSAGPAGMTWRDIWAMLRRSRALRILLLIDLLMGLPLGISSALIVLVARDVLGVGTASGALLLAYSAVSIASVPLWTRINRRLSKQSCVAASSLLMSALTLLLLLVPHGDVWSAVAVFGTVGLSYGGGQLMLKSMMADIAEDEGGGAGLLFGLLTMTGKVGLAVAVGIAYPVLSLIGYEPGGANATMVLDAVMAVYLGVPFAINVLIALLCWSYPAPNASVGLNSK